MKKNLLMLLFACTSFNLLAQIPTTGLIGYWPFNGNANDSSGNGHNGVVTGATLTTDRFGNPNAAYLFGNTSQYITVADAVPLRLSNTNFTISCWINQSSILSNQEAIVTKRGITLQNGYILNVTGTLAPSPGLINYQVSGGIDPKVLSDSIVSLNTWHHVAILYTLSNQQVRIYVDGIKHADTSGIPSPNPSTVASLVFGNDQSNGPYAFHGKIDDIAIYNRALSLAEIEQIYEPCDTIDIAGNIIAQYNFTGNANDNSGNNHNGTVSGATLATDRFGNANMAYLFNGTNAFITVPDQAALRLSNTDFTISAWIIHGTVVSSSEAILSKRLGTGGGQQGYTMNVTGSGSTPPERLSFNVSGGTDPKALSDSMMAANTWYHVAVVYDLSRQTMMTYIDGVVNSVRTGMPSPNAATAVNMNIGTDSAGNQYNFNGKIDDIIIYNRSLTACDIDSLFHLPNPVLSGINNSVPDNTLEIFPNPVKDYFTVSNLQSGRITISNAYGQLVKSGTITAADKVNIADLPAGLYVVSISTTAQQVFVKKLIKD